MNEPSREQRALAAVERERDELRAELARLQGSWDRLVMRNADNQIRRDNARDRAEKAEATIARVEALAAEHAECSGCRTPWWLRAALEGGGDAAKGCHGDRDGDCSWTGCPQLRDGEPVATGRHCPLDEGDGDE